MQIGELISELSRYAPDLNVVVSYVVGPDVCDRDSSATLDVFLTEQKDCVVIDASID